MPKKTSKTGNDNLNKVPSATAKINASSKAVIGTRRRHTMSEQEMAESGHLQQSKINVKGELRRLQDHLIKYFTPSDMRRSRVASTKSSLDQDTLNKLFTPNPKKRRLRSHKEGEYQQTSRGGPAKMVTNKEEGIQSKSVAAAVEERQQGQIIENENVEEEAEIIQVEVEGVKQPKIGNAIKTVDNTGHGQLSNHSDQLKMDDKSEFSYKVEVSGYQPEEINVELQGNKIVVRAEYQEQYGDDDFVHHQFVRSVPIPSGINMGTFKCKMDNDGRHLCICAQRESAAETRIIPIIFEQSEQPKKEIKLEIHH